MNFLKDGVNMVWQLSKNFGGKTQYLNIEGIFEDLIFSNSKVAVFKDSGNPVVLTRTFLSSTWGIRPTNKTFLEAHSDAVVNNHKYLSGFDLWNGLEGVSLVPQVKYTELTLKDFVEERIWYSLTEDEMYPKMSNGLWNGYSFTGERIDNPVTQTPLYDFDTIINNLLHPDGYKYIQVNTNKKLYADSEGIKDFGTNQLVELEPSLYLNGAWYLEGTWVEEGGETPVEEPTLMNLFEAVAGVNWDTQYIVYKKNESGKIEILTKDDYENGIIGNQIHTNYHKYDTLQNFLLDDNWEIINK